MLRMFAPPNFLYKVLYTFIPFNMLISMSRTVLQIPFKYTLLMQHNKVSFKAFASANHLSCISYCCIKHLRYSLSLSLCSFLLALLLYISVHILWLFLSLSLSHTHTLWQHTAKHFAHLKHQFAFNAAFSIHLPQNTRNRSVACPNPPPPMPHATCNKMRGWSGWREGVGRLINFALCMVLPTITPWIGIGWAAYMHVSLSNCPAVCLSLYVCLREPVRQPAWPQGMFAL